MVFGACVFIDNTYAQSGYVPPPRPLPPPRFQSVQSLYGAATGIPADRAGDIGGRFRISRICGYAAGGWTLAAHGRSLSATDISRKKPRGPPPGSLRGRRSNTGVLFLLLRSFRVWLWLRLAAILGRILVPNIALFVIGPVRDRWTIYLASVFSQRMRW